MNPNYKYTVGNAIYGVVQNLSNNVGSVTGMLIELPVPQIRMYLLDYNLFLQRI